MKTQVCLAVLLGIRCGAFIPAHVGGRGTAQATPIRSTSSHTLRSSSPPADDIDVYPSDVSPGNGPVSSSLSSSSSSPSTAAAAGGSGQGLSLADELLQTIYSGVGEGYIPYSDADKRAIEELIVELESDGGGDADVLFPRDLDKLDGRWRLVFTNNLIGATGGGLGSKLSPVALKDVYQVVDSAAGVLTNIVYARVSPPLFSETWGKLGERVRELAETVEDRVSFPVDFNIRHDFEVSSQSKPAQIELVQKELKLMNVEDASKRSIALPALQPFAKAAAGRFDTTYLGLEVRISRGRFGELRVFQRAA